jgi:hypothetical protein
VRLKRSRPAWVPTHKFSSASFRMLSTVSHGSVVGADKWRNPFSKRVDAANA